MTHPHPFCFGKDSLWVQVVVLPLRTKRYLYPPRGRKMNSTGHPSSKAPNCVLPPSPWCSWFVHLIFAETFLLPVPSLGRVYGISWEGLTAKHFGNLPSTESDSTNDFKENDDTCGNQPFFLLIATSQHHLEMCCFEEIQSDIEDAIAKYNEATSRLAEAEKNKAQADQVPWHSGKRSPGDGSSWVMVKKVTSTGPALFFFL